MKLNFPTTWTNQKIQVLLLLTLLRIQQAKSGSEFSKCLSNDFYNAAFSFASSVADKQMFCCNTCSNDCASMSPTCPLGSNQVCLANGGGNRPFQCNKIIGQSEFCVSRDNYVISLPGGLCGGMFGSDLPANVTIGTCPSSEAIATTLGKSQTSPPNFSWLCCSENLCREPTGVSVDTTTYTANTNCDVGQYSLMCFQDNGAWSCTGKIATYLNITEPIGDCVMQVVIPSTDSTETTPTVIRTTTYAHGTSKITSVITEGTGTDDSTPTPDKSGNNNNSSSNSQVRAIAIAGLVISLLALVMGCLFFGILADEANPVPPVPAPPQPVQPNIHIIINNLQNTFTQQITNLRNIINQQQNTITQQAIELRRIERQIEY
jgi:hypothetical protein